MGTHESEMSLLINRLCRCAFTHTNKGISSLSIHCTETALRQIWINPSSALHSFPPKPASYLAAVLQFTWVCSSLVQKILVWPQSVFSADCSVFGPVCCTLALVTLRYCKTFMWIKFLDKNLIFTYIYKIITLIFVLLRWSNKIWCVFCQPSC